jgi:hypothetical protein
MYCNPYFLRRVGRLAFIFYHYLFFGRGGISLQSIIWQVLGEVEPKIMLSGVNINLKATGE